MPNKLKNILDEYVQGLFKIIGDDLEQIILYGSYARGDFNENSDIDIMILTDLTDKRLEDFFEKIVEIAYDIECDNNFIIHLSPLVKNIDRFNYWLDTIPFYINIKNEGVTLNG